MIKIDFNKALNLFKNGRYITILDNKKNGEQWISNGAAIYNIGNTEFDAVNIKPILPNSKGEWRVESNYTYTYSKLEFEDIVNYEELCDRLPETEITHQGETYIPFILPNREVMFINKKYLKPFVIETSGVSAFYVRTSQICGNYLAVKDGMILKGIILPVELVEKDRDTHFYRNLKSLYEMCSLKYYSSIPEDTKEKEDEPENDD